MDYRDDYERRRRYRDEGAFRVSDRRGDRRDWDRRDYERGRSDEPGVLERFIDEMRSWFHDEDVRRRGRDDRNESRGWGGGERGWGDPSAWGPERGGPWSERGRSGGAGPHAGRGPRGYRRADERIREDVCDALCEHGYVDASDIEVTVANGEVTLGGFVRERAEKRMAEDAVEQIPGVREVHNQLRLGPGGSGQEPGDRPGDPRFRVA